MIQDRHRNQQDLSEEMTVRLGERFEHLCQWATDKGLEYPLELSYYTLNLTPKIVGVPNLIEEASFEESAQILQQWPDNVFATDLLKFARAFHLNDELAKNHQPLSHQGSAKRTTRRYSPKSNNTFLLTLLIHPLSHCEDEQTFKLRRSIRLWLALQAVDRVVRYQNVADANVAGTASFLMLDENDPKWVVVDRLSSIVKTQLQNRSGSFLQFTTAIKNAAKRVKSETKSRSARHFLNCLQAVAEGLNTPTALKADSTTDIRHLREHYVPVASPTRFEVNGVRFEVLANHFGDGDDSTDSLIVDVDPTDTQGEQTLKSRSILIQSVELAHYLPWTWDRLLPPEVEAVESWVTKQLNTSELQEKLAGAFVWIALKLSRTLAFVERISIDGSFHDEWCFSEDFTLLSRTAPRRHSGWKPDELTQSLVHPVDEILELRVPKLISSALLMASENIDPRPSTLKELWTNYYKISSETWFNRYSEGLMARTKSGMLVNRAPQRVFNKTADSRFARLLTSHPKSALPGACSYDTWDVKAIEKGMDLTIHNQEGHPSNLNLVGSRLVPFESVLIAEIQDATQRLRTARQKDLVSYHNALSQYVVMALYAATGARLLRDPFESPAFFNLEAGCVYINDKTDDELHTGRLVPLPEKTRTIVQEYRNHLLILSRSIVEHRSELADHLNVMTNGRPSKVPFFFLLDRQLKWHSIADAQKLEGALFQWALPSNLFRHRYAQQLSNAGISSEIIEGWMGHSERGVGTYGDFSARCWSVDAAESMETLNTIFERLGFEVPPSNHRGSPPLLSLPTKNSSYREPTLFGLKYRARYRKLRRQKAIREARDDIALFLDERSIDQLQPEELKQLINQMLSRSDQMPHPQASLRYRVLAKVVDRSSLDVGSRFTKRIVLLREEQTHISDKVAQYLALFPAIQNWALEMRSKAQKSNLTKSKALVVGCCLLAAEKRISYTRLLQDVAHGRHYRIVQRHRQIYLEYSETLIPSEFGAPVQRHEISYKTAALLAYGLESTRYTSELPFKNIRELAPLAELYREDQEAQVSSATELICWISNIVDQCNLVQLPGMVAGALSGRVPPTSGSWTDHLRLADKKHVKRPVAEKRDSTAELPEVRLKTGVRSEHSKVRLQQQAVDFKAAIYAFLKEYKPTKQQAQKTARNIERLSHENRHVLSSAMLLLGYWIVDLTRAGKGKKGQKFDAYASSSLKDYWSAISGPFNQLAYSVDLMALDSEDVTELCVDMLEYKHLSSQSNRYFGDRLLQFFRWAEKFDVVTPDWSELDIDVEERTVSPGLISLEDYRSIQSCIAHDAGLNRDQRLMMGFVLLCSYRFGLRSKEALALLGRDWQDHSGRLWVLVQNNQYRKLKSQSSRRVVPLLFRLDDFENDLISKVLARYDIICDNSKNRPILCERQGKKRVGLVEDSANFSAGLIIAIRTMTQNQDLVLHHMRHTFFNKVAAVLLNLNTPTAQALTQGIDKPALRQCVLGSNIECSRRIGMALARLMGHRSPRTGLLNYCHLLTEWADSFTPVESIRVRRLRNATDINQWPDAPRFEMPQLMVEPNYPELTLERLLQAARLVSQGHTFTRAGALVDLHPSVARRLEKVLTEATKKQVFKRSLPGEKAQWFEGDNDAKALLAAISPSAWQRILQRSQMIEYQHIESIKALKLKELPVLVSRRRHLVLDKTSHARFIKQFLTLMEVQDDQLTVVARFDDPEMIGLMMKAGFAVQSEQYIDVGQHKAKAGRKTRPWTVKTHFLHGFPLTTRRRSSGSFGEIIFQPSPESLLRNGHELAATFLIFGVYCRLVQKSKKQNEKRF